MASVDNVLGSGVTPRSNAAVPSSASGGATGGGTTVVRGEEHGHGASSGVGSSGGGAGGGVGGGGGAGGGAGAGSGSGASSGGGGGGSAGGSEGASDRKDHEGDDVDESLVLGVHVPGFFLLRRLGAALAALTGGGEQPADRLAEARQFVTRFDLAYGSRRPQFMEMSFASAVSTANQQSRELFVYLHSPDSLDSDDFCKNTLCNAELVEYLNGRFAVWGGSIRCTDGYATWSECNACAFPFIGIYVPSQQRNKYQRLWTHEGPIEPAALLRKLRAVMASVSDYVNGIRAQRIVESEDRRIRQEQDAAYQQSLERDRKKADERRAEQERAKQAEEAEKAKKLAVETNIQRAKERLTPEPAPRTPQTTRLRISLPSGTRVQRRFLASETLQALRDYVTVTLVERGEAPEGVDPSKHELSSTFPRRLFGSSPDDLGKTLAECDLAPQGVLRVDWP